MKPSTLEFYNTLRYDQAIKVSTRLIAEWEYNRYYAPTVTVTPDQTTDPNWYTAYGDTSSMVQPFRPTAGIAKLRADAGAVPISLDSRTPGTTRYYPSGDNDLYNYFSSLQRSQLAEVDGGYPFATPIKISAVYPEPLAVNKIVIGFESGYALPASYSIQVSPDGTAWQTINTDAPIATDGTVTLYHAGPGTGWGGTGWDITTDYDHPVVIQGVRVNLYSMNKGYSHADVLQISPRLENDLSDYLVKYDVEFTQDSPSFIAPMGKASSNTASLTLSNIDGRFNNENENSLYYKMIGKKIRFKMDIGFDTTSQGGNGVEYVREFTMWADQWGASNNSTIDVQLKDSSVLLQERTMPSMFLQNYTVGQIVWHTLDRVGLTNYRYSTTEVEDGYVIPWYWPSDTAESSNPRWARTKVNTRLPPTTTIWDELSAICEATQTALYFDENDVLQIKSRRAMYDEVAPINWNLDAVPNGRKLPDVIDSSVSEDLVTNQVEITYKPCALSNDANGFPKMETVWQPTAATNTSIVPATSTSSGDTTVSLRATSLHAPLSINDQFLYIHPDDAVFWPFESDVNIQGEFLHYLGKEYGYFDAQGVYRTAVCKTQDDQTPYDALNVYLSFKNAYTGRLAITARGLYGSTVFNHNISTRGDYTSMLTDWNFKVWAPLSGYIVENDGYITQTTPVVGSPNYSTGWNLTYHLRHHNSIVQPLADGKTVWYGGRFRMPSTAGIGSIDAKTGVTHDYLDSTEFANWNVGGMFFAGDWGNAGYYLELTPTTQIDGWEKRRWRHELCLVAFPPGGPAFQVPGTNANAIYSSTYDTNGNPVNNLNGNKGFGAAILQDEWYDVDISYSTEPDGTTVITVFLNGVVAGTWNIAANARPNYTNQWRWGTHVRGPSKMDIEYIYAVGQDDTNPLLDPDKTQFLDFVSGGYASGFVRNNIKFSTASNPLGRLGKNVIAFPQNLTWRSCVLDEYSPVVHEVRTFDVTFSDQYIPVINSYLYLTNSAQVECISYLSDASGAEFMLANASRDIAILNGQDDTTYGSGNSINQSMMVYGRVVYTAQQDSNIVKKDDDAIRRQGLIRTQITSRYLQTDTMANAVADWVLELWSAGVDELTVNAFGNPLIQVGDKVTMNFPTKSMYPATHQYYVHSIKNTFDNGYKSELTLRRSTTPVAVTANV